MVGDDGNALTAYLLESQLGLEKAWFCRGGQTISYQTHHISGRAVAGYIMSRAVPPIFDNLPYKARPLRTKDDVVSPGAWAEIVLGPAVRGGRLTWGMT